MIEAHNVWAKMVIFSVYRGPSISDMAFPSTTTTVYRPGVQQSFPFHCQHILTFSKSHEILANSISTCTRQSLPKHLLWHLQTSTHNILRLFGVWQLSCEHWYTSNLGPRYHVLETDKPTVFSHLYIKTLSRRDSIGKRKTKHFVHIRYWRSSQTNSRQLL